MTGEEPRSVSETDGVAQPMAPQTTAEPVPLGDGIGSSSDTFMPFGPRFVDEDDAAIAIGSERIGEPSPSHRANGSPSDEPGPFEPRLLEPDEGAFGQQHVVWAPGTIAVERWRGWSSGSIAATGLAVILSTWLFLSVLSFLIGLFGQSVLLGAIGVCAAGAGVGLVGCAVSKEVRSFRSLQVAEQLRRVLGPGCTNLEAARDKALQWVDRVEARLPDPNAARRLLRGADTLAEVRDVLQSSVADHLCAQAVALGQRAAVEGAMMVALCPHPVWDGLIAGGRSLLILRQIADLYGIRPGVAVTVTLLRRVAWTAAATSAVSLVSQGLTDHVA